MDDATRERCIDALKGYDESTCTLIRRLHIFAAAEATGNSLPKEALAELCPEYQGLVSALGEIKRLVSNNLPRVVYYDAIKKEALLGPYYFKVVECSWCTDDDLEESLICPSCYGTRKVQQTVMSTSTIEYDTLDVFVCSEVMDLLTKEQP